MAIVVVIDLMLALAAGLVLANRLATHAFPRHRPWIWLLILLGIHFAESFAFSASMATNLLSYCLAVVWSLLFTGKLQTREMRLLSLYACIPAISFLAICPSIFIFQSGCACNRLNTSPSTFSDSGFSVAYGK
jgi:hypothetical protein